MFPYNKYVSDPLHHPYSLQDGNKVLRRNDLGLWNLPPMDVPGIVGYGSQHQPLYDQQEPAPSNIDPGISAPSQTPQQNPQTQQLINSLLGKRI